MSDVQLENGYLMIASELAEAFSRFDLSAHESRIVWSVLRMTYGFQRKSAKISLNDFLRFTKIKHKPRISEAIRSLVDRNIINKRKNVYSINKNYDKWKLRKSVITEKRNNRYGKPEKPLRKTVKFTDGAKDNIKDNIKASNLTPFLDLSLKFHCKQKADGICHQDFKNVLTRQSKIVINGAKALEELVRINKESLDDIKRVLDFILSDTGNNNGWLGWKKNVVSLASIRKNKNGTTKYFKIKNQISINKKPVGYGF